MKRLVGAAAAALMLCCAGAASAATFLSYTLPGDTPDMGFNAFSLGDLSGRYTVTINSSRAFAEASATTAEFLDYHLHPVSGPGLGFGYRALGANDLAFRSGSNFAAVDFASIGSTEGYGCCELSGNEWVPYNEHWNRETQLFGWFTFAPGDGPINITITLSAIPEPATWAMMIVGFGLAGGAIRRSRQCITSDSRTPFASNTPA